MNPIKRAGEQRLKRRDEDGEGDLELREVRGEGLFESLSNLLLTLAESEKDLEHPASLDWGENTSCDGCRILGRGYEARVHFGRANDWD